MITKLVSSVSFVAIGLSLARADFIGAAVFGGLVVLSIVIEAIERARFVKERLGREDAIASSEGELRALLEEQRSSLEALEWDREVSARAVRPLEEHPLIAELTGEGSLRAVSGVELYQRVLTVVAGFTKCGAAAVVSEDSDKNLNSGNIVSFGVSGRRFEHSLRSLLLKFKAGDQMMLGVSDSFEHHEIWGGFAAFGHRFSVTKAVVVNEEGSVALLWLGYPQGSAPSAAELESIDRLVATISSALIAHSRLRQLDSRALIAESEKAQTSRMLAQVSHDVRTPLSNVRAILSLFENRAFVDEREIPELAKVALNNCDELGELVSDVIDFNRSRAGQLVARKDVVDLCVIAKRVHEAFSVSALQRGLILKLDSIERGLVWGDVGHLKRVVTNLVSNAIKYTEAGEVSIRVGFEAGRVFVSVADTGVGMTAEQLGRLFTPFTRFHADKAEGLGLGMSITKFFVEEHGGTITVQSRPGSGSMFTVRLQQYVSKAEQQLNELDTDSISVLLVDDDKDLGISLARLLAAQKVVVTSVCSVSAAREALLSRKFSAVVSDLAMPGGGGEAILELARDPQTGHPPVFILSGDCDVDIVSRLKAFGASEVFEKPIDTSTLVAALLTAHAAGVMHGRQIAVV